MFTGKESIPVSNKSKSETDRSLSKKPISHKAKMNPRKVQEALIRTQ